MKALLYYLVQVIVTSGILYAWYHFALRNKKFHRYNRFYLLAATVISITIPFLDIPVYFTQSETEFSFVLRTLTVISSTGSDAPVIVVANQSLHTNWLSWQNLSYSFYIFIASIALLRIIISLIKIRRIAKNNPVEKLGNIRFVNSNEPRTPFSFFRWLFWNKKIELSSEKGEQIFRHELFHIEQKHSWDIMYMELLTVVFWINPFFHLMKKEVKAIHEFLADQFAITENTKWQYAELLLMQALNTNQHLVNPFFHNQIKRRIAMISTSKKPSYQYLRKLMVLPLAAIVLALFAFSYKTKMNSKTKESESEKNLNSIQQDKDTTKPNIKFIEDAKTGKITPEYNGKIFTKIIPYAPTGQLSFVYENGDLEMISKEESDIIKKDYYSQINDFLDPVIDTIYNKDGTVVLVYKKGEQEKLTKIEADRIIRKIPGAEDKRNDIVFDKVEIEPSFPGGDSAWKRYLEKNANSLAPVDSGAPAGLYKVMVQFIVHEDGSLSDIKALTNHGYGMENETIRLISKGPKWRPAMQNGHIVSAYVKQPVTYAISEDASNFAIIENKTSIFWENKKKMLTLDPSVLYIGVENNITVACSGIDNKDLIVNISQGKITGENGKYRILVFSVGDDVILQVSTKDGKELGKQMFKTRTIPNLFD